MDLSERVAEWRRNELVRRAPNLKAASKQSGLSASRCSQIRRIPETVHRQAGAEIGEAAAADPESESAFALDLAARSICDSVEAAALAIQESVEAAALAIQESVEADGAATRALIQTETRKLLAALDYEDEDDEDDVVEFDAIPVVETPAYPWPSRASSSGNAYAGNAPPSPYGNVYAGNAPPSPYGNTYAR